MAVLKDANGEFCGDCGIDKPTETHTCKPPEEVAIADVEVAIQTLEDTLIRANSAWDTLMYTTGTRSAAHARMEKWLCGLKQRARVQSYHSNKREPRGN